MKKNYYVSRKTKIVATFGLSSNCESVLKKMIAAGMIVARLNFSHGSHEDHEKVIAMLRSLPRQLDRPVTILADLQGSKIRMGKLKAGQPIQPRKDRAFRITLKNVCGTEDIVSATYADLVIIVTGLALTTGSTNLIKLNRVGMED